MTPLSIPGFVFPALVSEYAGVMWHLLSQLQISERLAPARLEQMQYAQLGALLQHAFAHSPFWRERLGAADWSPGRPVDADLLARLPQLTRAELQQHFEAMRAHPLDPALGKTGIAQTSGSTGTPVRVEKCGAQSLLFDAMMMRDQQWHQRDFSKKLCAIRPRIASGSRPNWGRPYVRLVKTGPAAALNAENASLDEQLDWIIAEKPDYLYMSGSRLDGLTELALARGVHVEGLENISTYASAVTPEVRKLAQQVFGAAVTDVYTTEEVGYIALQCPHHPHYHVVSETSLVEIVDDDGQPVPAGQAGHVLVTVLHSFPMPLIRYRIGDMAVRGEACDCGRTLPVIGQILGRQESVLRLPDGRRLSPIIRARDFLKFAPIREYRVVLYADDVIDAFVKADAPLPAAAQRGIAAMIQEKLLYPFPTRVRQVGEIDWGKSWKRESFVRVGHPSVGA